MKTWEQELEELCPGFLKEFGKDVLSTYTSHQAKNMSHEIVSDSNEVMRKYKQVRREKPEGFDVLKLRYFLCGSRVAYQKYGIPIGGPMSAAIKWVIQQLASELVGFSGFCKLA